MQPLFVSYEYPQIIFTLCMSRSKHFNSLLPSYHLRLSFFHKLFIVWFEPFWGGLRILLVEDLSALREGMNSFMMLWDPCYSVNARVPGLLLHPGRRKWIIEQVDLQDLHFQTNEKFQNYTLLRKQLKFKYLTMEIINRPSDSVELTLTGKSGIRASNEDYIFFQSVLFSLLFLWTT